MALWVRIRRMDGMTLKQWLKYSGTSIKCLAHDIEVDASTVWRWVHGAPVGKLALANRIHLVTKGAVTSLELESSWAEWVRPAPRKPGKVGRPKKVRAAE